MASSIIFCYTKASAIWLADKLRSNNRDVALLHGNMDVADRERIAREFKDGKYKVLITTNVSSRGLDMPQVSLIVNYDPPVTHEVPPNPAKPDYDTYLHRIGRLVIISLYPNYNLPSTYPHLFRTGRFGKPGLAINLVDSDIVMGFVKAFETYFGRPITQLDAEDTDQLDEIEAKSRQYL